MSRLKLAAAVPVGGAIGVAGLAGLTHLFAAPRTYGVDDVPTTEVGIVLGAQVHPDGRPSGFLLGRLEVAAELWRRGRISTILVSGDNDPEHNAEPDAMKRWLVAQGIPETVIACDPAGHDTFATMARAVGVYGLSEVTVISQTYHLPRALTTARLLGLTPYGVGDTSARQWLPRWRRGEAREVFANLKMVGELLTRDRPTTADNTVLSMILGRWS
ncbi:SanA/YdcF family protein [Propionibacteriaceae bacterium Y2011]|uniref:SanA/YdcF family protein n=1 Tax=Microlunatus sp. Y2014 TaxID=3418488 RepID=UPI003B4C52BF